MLSDNVRSAISDINLGMNYAKVAKKNNLSRKQVYAITLGLDREEQFSKIVDVCGKVTDNLRSGQIKRLYYR